MAAPSFQDMFDAAKAEAIDRRPDLTFDEGDISEFYAAALAAMADHLVGYFSGRFKATYLDGASGDDLTVLADDHWNIQRNLATFATGQVSFVRTGLAAGVLPAGFVVATEKDALGSEIQYALDADLNWALNEVGPKTANVTSLIAGLSQNSDLNKVTRLITTPFDTSFVVSNPASKMAGGDDEESDEALRERVRNFPATIRRATLSALEYGAKTVSGVAKASAVEEVDGSLIPTGIVTLYVTDSSGNSSVPMVAAVSAEIRNWRAAGVIVNVSGGAVLLQDVSVVLTARAGTDTTALVAAVQAAIVSRINKLKIGETLSPDVIKQAVLNVDDSILSVAVTVPSVAVVPAAGQILKAGVVSVS